MTLFLPSTFGETEWRELKDTELFYFPDVEDQSGCRVIFFPFSGQLDSDQPQ